MVLCGVHDDSTAATAISDGQFLLTKLDLGLVATLNTVELLLIVKKRSVYCT